MDKMKSAVLMIMCLLSFSVSKTCTNSITLPPFDGNADNHLGVNTTTIPLSDGTLDGKSTEPASNSLQIMGEASHLIYFKVGVAIHQYFLPVIVVLGIPGNLLSLLVMTRKHNRRISCCLYMAALAVCDTYQLYVGAHYWTVTSAPWGTRPIGLYECKIIAWHSQAVQMVGTLIILCMTLDRCIAVTAPLKAQVWCTTRRAKITIIIAFIFGFIFTVPYFFILHVLMKRVCAVATSLATEYQVFLWLFLAISFFIPFVSLLIMNSLIIVSLKRRHKYFQGQDVDSAEKQDRGKEATPSSGETQLTVMLLAVTFVFLVSTGPQFIRYIAYLFVDNLTGPKTYAYYILFVHGSNKLFLANSGVNFYLYCLSGRKFRQDVKRLFFRARKPQMGSESTSQTRVTETAL